MGRELEPCYIHAPDIRVAVVQGKKIVPTNNGGFLLDGASLFSQQYVWELEERIAYLERTIKKLSA